MAEKSCYDLHLRDAWCLEYFFSKIQKLNKVPRWYAIPIQSHMSYKFEKPFLHMQLVFSLSFVKLLWPFVRITSYAQDQDHVHVHSHAILLHLEDSKYIPHPSTNKTPRCAMFISLQSYHHNVWAIQKEIKDAYPKKVCHMPTRHVKKKRKDAYPKKVCHTPTRCVKKKRERKRKYSPYQKHYKGNRIHVKEFSSIIHQKISTHLHILIKAYDLFLLWIRSLT